jgi:ribosomal protein S18 acetylase RimI-like enzyme
MQLTVQAASEADASILSKLGAATFYDTFRPYNTEEDMQDYITKTYNEMAISQNLQNPNIHYALVYENDLAIGYLKLLLETRHDNLSGRSIELEKIYVLQSHLGSGAGKVLMDYAINFSKDQQYDQLFLGVWEENKRAVRFYEKNGFEVFTTRAFTLGSTVCDDFMMKLDLHQRA